MYKIIFSLVVLQTISKANAKRCDSNPAAQQSVWEDMTVQKTK